MMMEIGTTPSGITDEFLSAFEEAYYGCTALELLETPDDPIPYTLANSVSNVVEKRRETLRK
jgi:hypothetical protein